MRLILMGFLLMFSLFGCGGRSIEDQAKALESREFSVKGWAAGTQEQRGEMVASLLEKHAASSLTAKDVISLLGAPTSYYEYDEYPAYMVGPKSIESEYGKGYVLAFVTDKGTGRVVKVLFIPEVRP
jgi:hypothetical protein